MRLENTYSNLLLCVGGIYIKKIKIVKVDSNYCNYLRNFDDKITYNAGNKELRDFAPLSSPKHKHIKLKNTSNNYTELDLNKKTNDKNEQYRFNY